MFILIISFSPLATNVRSTGLASCKFSFTLGVFSVQSFYRKSHNYVALATLILKVYKMLSKWYFFFKRIWFNQKETNRFRKAVSVFYLNEWVKFDFLLSSVNNRHHAFHLTHTDSIDKGGNHTFTAVPRLSSLTYLLQKLKRMSCSSEMTRYLIWCCFRNMASSPGPSPASGMELAMASPESNTGQALHPASGGRTLLIVLMSSRFTKAFEDPKRKCTQ